MNPAFSEWARQQHGGLRILLAAGLAILAACTLLLFSTCGSRQTASPSAPETSMTEAFSPAAHATLSVPSSKTAATHDIAVPKSELLVVSSMPEIAAAVSAIPTADPPTLGANLVPTKQTATVVAPIELLLDTHINQQSTHETAVFLGFGTAPDKHLYANASDLERWRLRPPAVRPYLYRGENYYSLDAIPGLSYRLDASTESLWISASPGDFTGTIVDGLFPKNPETQQTPLGGFLNYDFLGSRSNGLNSINGLFEAGVFNNWGVGTSSFVAQNLNNSDRQWIRLDSTWTHDDPDTMTTLQVGDSITDGGMTGQSVRLGGIQYGTNFSTRPYFITFPLPTIGGQAALPSTVQLYVNGILKETQQVAPGPFSVPAVPVVTGSGVATIVVRNILGQQQVISAPFYATPELLKQGLDDYSFSVGELRDNYGLESNDYGPVAASGLFRRGFNANFTGEFRGEASPGLEVVSAGGALAAAQSGLFTGALAASHSRLGDGVLSLVGFQNQWQIFNAGMNVQLASPHFTELGYNGLPAPHQQITANLGASFGHAGSAGIAYLDQDSPLFGRARLLTANYSVNIGKNGFLGVNAFHTLGGSTNNGIFIIFTLPFGERSNLSMGVTRQNDVDQSFAQVQENLPSGTGSGYLVSTQLGPNPTNQAEYDYQNGVGTYRVGAFSTAGQTGYQAEASGGLAFIGGGLFPTRQVTGSFGLVEVPGFSNVTVYQANQPVATTDKSGDALVPMLLPYQVNPISINADNLPLDTNVESLDMDAIPRYRSGVIVKFPIKVSHGATFTIRQTDGKPLPAGASVHILGRPASFPVGLEGEVYVTGLAPKNILEASWEHKRCEFTVYMPKTTDPLPDLGTFTCNPRLQP